MITAAKFTCPVCAGEHAALKYLVGISVIACDKLTPVGEARLFPALDLIVAGAGLGVDVKPVVAVVAVERTESLAELEAKAAKYDEADRIAALKAKIAEREAAQS